MAIHTLRKVGLDPALFIRLVEVKARLRRRYPAVWVESARAEFSRKTYTQSSALPEVRYTVPILLTEWLLYPAADRQYLLAALGLHDEQPVKRLLQPYLPQLLAAPTIADLILGTDQGHLAKLYLDFGDPLASSLQLVQHKIQPGRISAQYYWQVAKDTLLVTDGADRPIAVHRRLAGRWYAIGPNHVTEYLPLVDPSWIDCLDLVSVWLMPRPRLDPISTGHVLEDRTGIIDTDTV